MKLFHCAAWDEESQILDEVGLFESTQSAQEAVHQFLRNSGAGYGWTCQVNEFLPLEGEGFYVVGTSFRWEYGEPNEE